MERNINLNETKYNKYVQDIQAAAIKLNVTARGMAGCVSAMYSLRLDSHWHDSDDIDDIDITDFVVKSVGTEISAANHPGWDELDSCFAANSKLLGRLMAELIEANALPESQMAKLIDPASAAEAFRTGCNTMKACRATVAMFQNADGTYDEDFYDFMETVKTALGYWVQAIDPKAKLTVLPSLID